MVWTSVMKILSECLFCSICILIQWPVSEFVLVQKLWWLNVRFDELLEIWNICHLWVKNAFMNVISLYLPIFILCHNQFKFFTSLLWNYFIAEYCLMNVAMKWGELCNDVAVDTWYSGIIFFVCEDQWNGTAFWWWWWWWWWLWWLLCIFQCDFVM